MRMSFLLHCSWRSESESATAAAGGVEKGEHEESTGVRGAEAGNFSASRRSLQIEGELK